jgi:hypothetical protein
MKQIILSALLFWGLTCLQMGAEKRFRISFLSGINAYPESGINNSESESFYYHDDFPIASAHATFRIGAAVSCFLSRNFGIELEANNHFPGRITRSDPESQDQVKTRTPRHVSLAANIVWRFSSRRLSPYVKAGFGIDQLSATEEKSESAHGYEVAFDPPEKTRDTFIQYGAGLSYLINPRLGIRIEADSQQLRNKLVPQNSSNVYGGIFWSF